MSVNSLQPAHFSRIFYYLQDADLKALGGTSKKMRQLVIDELKERDLKLERLLSPSLSQPTRGFITTRQFNIQRLSEARVFGLGDKHRSKDSAEDRSALVAFLSRRAPVILVVEGMPSMRQSDNIFQEYFSCSNISSDVLIPVAHEPFFVKNLYAIGWDVKRENQTELKEAENQEFDRILKRRQLKIELFDEAARLSRLLPPEFHTPNIWRQLGYVTAKQLQEDLSTSPYLSNYLLQRFATVFFNKLDNFVKNNFETMSDEFFYACKDYRDLYLSSKKLEDELYEETLAFQEKDIERMTLEFPARTASMITTLQQVDTYRRSLGIQGHYVVVEAGIDHLEASEEKAEYDLSSLYQELEHHKAAILLPVIAKAQLIFREAQLPKMHHGTCP